MSPMHEAEQNQSGTPSMGTAMALSAAPFPLARRSFRRRTTSSAAVLLPLPGTPAMPTMCLQ